MSKLKIDWSFLPPITLLMTLFGVVHLAGRNIKDTVMMSSDMITQLPILAGIVVPVIGFLALMVLTVLSRFVAVERLFRGSMIAAAGSYLLVGIFYATVGDAYPLWLCSTLYILTSLVPAGLILLLAAYINDRCTVPQGVIYYSVMAMIMGGVWYLILSAQAPLSLALQDMATKQVAMVTFTGMALILGLGQLGLSWAEVCLRQGTTDSKDSQEKALPWGHILGLGLMAVSLALLGNLALIEQKFMVRQVYPNTLEYMKFMTHYSFLQGYLLVTGSAAIFLAFLIVWRTALQHWRIWMLAGAAVLLIESALMLFQVWQGADTPALYTVCALSMSARIMRTAVFYVLGNVAIIALSKTWRVPTTLFVGGICVGAGRLFSSLGTQVLVANTGSLALAQPYLVAFGAFALLAFVVGTLLASKRMEQASLSYT